MLFQWEGGVAGVEAVMNCGMENRLEMDAGSGISAQHVVRQIVVWIQNRCCASQKTY
jgi:hypothetical protein